MQQDGGSCTCCWRAVCFQGAELFDVWWHSCNCVLLHAGAMCCFVCVFLASPGPSILPVLERAPLSPLTAYVVGDGGDGGAAKGGDALSSPASISKERVNLP